MPITSPKKLNLFWVVFLFGTAFIYLKLAGAVADPQNPAQNEKAVYAGSSQCKSCHEKFYNLWEPSHHGKAMQPYTQEFAKANLTSHDSPINIGQLDYQAFVKADEGYVLETNQDTSSKYPILHVMGGKNVYYFLTMLDRGRLQVLPVAYDIQRKRWFDTAASGIRHFTDRPDTAAYNWKDRPYTFNTSCFSCHVSGLEKNYDAATDSYKTTWREPGISCEICHGPCDEHIKAALEAQPEAPKDLKLKTITQGRGFTADQTDAACLACHAKAIPITSEFVPGQEFYQHYDLVTLEHPDYYPDGRDLGENYTATSWFQSPCAKTSELDCLYCHTTSGRYRFEGNKANQACLPCHEDKSDIKAHSHHSPKLVTCVNCHMPKTEFGRMTRTDHSMRPPMPQATIQFNSPNACNLCHKKADAKWAQKHVNRWHKDDYQKPVIEIASLINEARQQKWTRLNEMLLYLENKNRDEIFANSLVRLLRSSRDSRIPVVLMRIIQNDPSALIRSSAAEVLELHADKNTADVLAKSASDPYRLVRIRAAASLASLPPEYIPAQNKPAVQKAFSELVESMMSMPDDPTSHYNLGNYYAGINQPQKAIERYEFAIKLDSELVLPYINAALVYNQLGQNTNAAKLLEKATKIDPSNDAAHLNLAMLYGEMGQFDKAESSFKKTFELNPKSAAAAYNLSVLLSDKDPQNSIAWGKKALDLEPANTKYAYTLGFYLSRMGKFQDAIETLMPSVNNKTANADIYLLLGDIHQRLGNKYGAIEIYKRAADNQSLSEQERNAFKQRLAQLSSR